MLKELIHLARHAPATLLLQRKLDHVDLYDELMKRAQTRGMFQRRRELVSDLRGEVLELGCGTGLMFAHYAPGVHVVGVELDPDFLERGRARAAEARARVQVVSADAQKLPFDAASFDAVVSSLVFCSVESPPAALAEVRRVLAPGGQLRMIEHVISPRPVAAKLMRAADPIWLRLNHQGCHLDRDTERAVREAGFTIDRVLAFQVFSPGLPAFPTRAIYARNPCAAQRARDA